MAVSIYFNRVKYTPTLGGTGDFVTSAAVSGFRTPATASIPDGSIVSYVAFSSDQSQWETGQGTYTSGTTTLARTTVRESSNAGAKVNFTAAPTVALDFQAQDITNLPPIAINGATIGTNALAVTGTAAISGNTTVNAISTSGNAVGVGGVNVSVSSTLSVILQGASVPTLANSGVFLHSGTGVGWTSTTAGGTIDTGLSRNAAGVIQFSTTTNNASGAWLAAKGTLTGGTLADQAQVLAITATQPASPTGTQNAIAWTITGAGTVSQANYAHKLLYSSGYTGSSFNAALNVVNTNAGALSSGLFVGLADTTPSVSAALIVDNGATVQPIFLARDNGTTVFTIADGGTVTATGSLVSANLTVGAGAFVQFGNRSALDSPADGIVRIANNVQNDFNRLQLGGTTSSFPSIKRSTTVLQFKLADDSAFTSFTATTGILNALATDAGQTTATVCADNTTGQLYKGSGTVGICLGTSSARYKNRIVDAGEGLAEIVQLQPKRFWYNKDAGDNGAKEQVGFVAEDVAKVLPGLVGLDVKGRPNTFDMLGLIPIMVRSIKELRDDISDKDRMLALTVSALQEQQERIQQLEARVA